MSLIQRQDIMYLYFVKYILCLMSQGLDKNIYAIKHAEKRYFSIKNQIGVLIFPGRFCNLCPKNCH